MTGVGSAASAIRSASNFFALGGDSLSAMRAMARLSEQVTCELPLSALFQNAVVCELAAFVEAKRGASGAGANGAVARVAIERVLRAAGAEYAVSFAQERLWFLDRSALSTKCRHNTSCVARSTPRRCVVRLARWLRGTRRCACDL